ncbi:MAG: esterase [Bacteroidia bacterium]|jgi:esterase
MELFAKKYGNGPETILIVHGLFGSLDNWHNMARSLSEKFTVFTVDLRNHGNSPHDEEMNYSVMADDLANFMLTHHLEKAHLIGHSMGGKVVMKVADLHPSIVDRLIVVDIAPKKYPPGHAEIFSALLALPIKDFNSRQEAEDALAKRVDDEGVRLFLLKNLKREKGGGFSWKMNLLVIDKNYDAISEKLSLSWPFSNPTLFVKGALSQYIKAEDEADILEAFPNAVFKSIPESGHWVHADNPTTFLSVVDNFLS